MPKARPVVIDGASPRIAPDSADDLNGVGLRALGPLSDFELHSLALFQ